jgi:hypothetical protein
MTRKELEQIFDESGGADLHNNVFRGLVILAKYAFGSEIVSGALHDEIYSINIDTALEMGLTREDAIELRNLNWYIVDELNCFSCFV